MNTVTCSQLHKDHSKSGAPISLRGAENYLPEQFCVINFNPLYASVNVKYRVNGAKCFNEQFVLSTLITAQYSLLLPWMFVKWDFT